MWCASGTQTRTKSRRFTAQKGTRFKFSFAITIAGVLPCDGPKTSPRTSSMVQIIFLFYRVTDEDSISETAVPN